MTRRREIRAWSQGPPSGSATGGKGGKRCLWQNRACRVERLRGKKGLHVSYRQTKKQDRIAGLILDAQILGEHRGELPFTSARHLYALACLHACSHRINLFLFALQSRYPQTREKFYAFLPDLFLDRLVDLQGAKSASERPSCRHQPRPVGADGHALYQFGTIDY